MKKITVIFSVVLAIAGVSFVYNHKQKKETYNKEEQKQYDIIYNKEHPVICKIPHPYIKYDSIIIREQFIVGRRCGISVNGVGTHVLINLKTD